MNTAQPKQPRAQPAMRYFRDQYGDWHKARTRKELQEKLGGSVAIVYRDKRNGLCVRAGYIVGRLWCSEWAPLERPA